MSIDIFKLPHFKSWIAELSKSNVKIAVAAEFSDGKLSFLGNTELGAKVFNKALKQKRKSSLCWLPSDPLPKQRKPINVYQKDQNIVRAEANKVLKHFMATIQSYGEGELLMWEKKVPVASIKYSNKLMSTIGFKSESIAMSDVIQWNQFDVKYLGLKPKHGLHPKISWRELLLLIIEIGYILMGLDPLKHVEVAVPHYHDDTKVDNNQQVDDTSSEVDKIEVLREIEENNDDEMHLDEPLVISDRVVDDVSAVRPDVEVLHDVSVQDGSEILHPFLKEAFKDSSVCVDKLVQVIQQPRLDDEFNTIVAISDGNHWVEVKVDKFYSAFVQHQVNTLDVIRIMKVEGFLEDRTLILVF